MEKKILGKREVIDLLSDDDNEPKCKTPQKQSAAKPPSDPIIRNPYLTDRRNLPFKHQLYSDQNKKPAAKKRKSASGEERIPQRQAGIVLEEDVSTVDDSTVQDFVEAQQLRLLQGHRAELYHDEEFPTLPSSIRGPKRDQKKVTCRCKGSISAKLDYTKQGKPYYRCAQNRCKYYSNAFQAELFHWYRFGVHTGHVVVQPSGFSANDLCQGRVGDCWFLSALAVVAERPDLISRLFPSTEMNEYGICKVNLFLDGYWKTVVVDNFFPCLIDKDGEAQLREAMNASLMTASASFGGTGRSLNGKSATSSSKFDPSKISDQCQEVLRDTKEFLEQDFRKQKGGVGRLVINAESIQGPVASQDLAYSKALRQQIWVPLLEKAYAKSHGSYQAISGGHIAEAFLDLTGAPTLVYQFDSTNFQPRAFWYQLLKFREKRLPIGCGTDQSQVGIIGMHAYSILDVVEVKNVSYQFFQETGVGHGNVSGFTEYDGTVRLLHIRNPHGKSEWKGEFSDHSDIWEKLLNYQGGRRLGSSYSCGSQDEGGTHASKLERTMKNDGKFWIDYDSFLLGFSNVDVVLAFQGNNAKSFASNFPAKKSNHRCTRAFEVSLLDESQEKVELYIMGIQKTRRGAGHGRIDRKVSYKVCDMGMLVGYDDFESNRDILEDDKSDDQDYWMKHTFSSIKGQMFGFQRNGHYHLTLNRQKQRSMAVMPISFGHPAATDKDCSFVLRFVSDAPLLIRELPAVPRLDKVTQQFCLSPPPAMPESQGSKHVLLDEDAFKIVQVNCLAGRGGVVFLYLCVDEGRVSRDAETSLSFSMTIHCRGMSCRTEEGILQHETVAKGKKFEAAWRKYNADFLNETRSRLLAVVYQSGQDYEFGSAAFTRANTASKRPTKTSLLDTFLTKEGKDLQGYVERGIFNCVQGNDAYNFAKELTKGRLRPEISMTEASIAEMELQQALAISRGEIQKQNGHLEPMDVAANPIVDSDLERALTESRKSTLMNRPFSEEDDLEKAIRLSLQEEKKRPAHVQTHRAEILDLTCAEDEFCLKRQASPDTPDQKALPHEAEEQRKEPISIEEKRRRAAEAAARRFAKK